MEIAINVRGNVHVIALSIAMILNGLRAIDKSFRFAVSVPSCCRHDIHSGSISLKEPRREHCRSQVSPTIVSISRTKSEADFLVVFSTAVGGAHLYVPRDFPLACV